MRLSSILLVVLLLASAYKNDSKFDEHWVVANHPDRVHALFESLNLDYPGLEEVQQQVEQGNLAKACKELCDYYASLDDADWRTRFINDNVHESEDYQGEAQQILRDSIVNQDRIGTFNRNADGSIDWHDLGPANDKEWGWYVNRFYFMSPVVREYHETGNAEYAEFADRIVRDWVTRNPAPAEKTGSLTWRVLEAGLRMATTWPYIFYGFQQADAFSTASRILFLSSLVEHANYLQQFHWYHHNHSVMEMNGLARVALLWPEFKRSQDWYQHAENQIIDDIEFLVYPDGAEIELSSHYHRVALEHFEDFYTISKKAGVEVDPRIEKGLESMWDFLAYTIRPNGTGLLNNDSDLDHNASILLDAAKSYNRPDWQYIVTHGASGTKPKRGPSIFLEYAGHAITRNNWSADAHWAFMDNGPWGWSHQHDDMLHISVHAHGRDLLVAGGRYWYKNPYDDMTEEGRSPHFWRGYFLHSASNNTILIDGKGQQPPPDQIKLDEPMPGSFAVNTPEYSFAQGIHREGYWGVEGKAVHTRSLVYLTDKYWLVIDRIDTDRPRKVEALWHYHPDCNVSKDGVSVTSNDSDLGNLRIIPSTHDWSTEIIKGQEEPTIQGWYSERYNQKEPNAAVIYSQKIPSSQTFGWLLLPAKGQVEEADFRLKQLSENEFVATVDLKQSKREERWSIDLSNGTVELLK